jgi:hypothetical protein
MTAKALTQIDANGRARHSVRAALIRPLTLTTRDQAQRGGARLPASRPPSTLNPQPVKGTDSLAAKERKSRKESQNLVAAEVMWLI